MDPNTCIGFDIDEINQKTIRKIKKHVKFHANLSNIIINTAEVNKILI